MLAESVAQQRLNLLLLCVFAAVALALTMVGLYGVTSYAVTQRMHEIGIRMALGAGRHDVLRLVVGQGLKLVLCGLGLGLVGALVLTRFLKTLLFGVSPTDPLTFAIIAVLLTAVALLACWIPAGEQRKLIP